MFHSPPTGFGGCDGFSMNAMALAGMMNMFASYMGMNMGGPMGMNQMGNVCGTMGNMGMNPMSGSGMSGCGMSGNNRADLSSNNSVGNYPSVSLNSSNLPGGGSHAGGMDHGAQNSSMYNQQQAALQNSSTYNQQQPVSSTGDMSAYGNFMSAMFGMNPGNVPAAFYSGYNTGGDGKNQLGVYNYQSSSAYGPTKNTSTGSTAGSSHSYKPY